jgi:signal transduction histidine kinase
VSRATWLLAGLSIRGALSWPTVLVAYFINLSVTAVGGFGASASAAQRVVAVTVATAAMFAVLALAAPAERRMSAGPARGLLSIGVFALAGAVRGAVVAAFFVAWGVDGGAAEVTRVFGGIALGLAVLTPMSLLVDQARGFAAARARLLAQRDHLTASVEHVSAQIEDRDEHVVERIRAALLGALDAPSEEAGRESSSADRLEAIARDVIRPLSHELAGAVPPVDAAASRTATGRIRWREILDEATRGRPLLPWATAALFSLLSAPALSASVGVGWAMIATALDVPILVALLAAANAVIHPFLSRFGLALRSLMVATAGIAVGLVAGVIAHWAFLQLGQVVDFGDARSPFIALALLVPGLAIPLAIARGSARARRRVLSDLTDSDIALTRQLVRLRQMQWSQQRMFARALHGPVQTLVMSGAARLRSAGTEELTSRASELRNELLVLLDATSATGDRLTWSEGVRRIEATWQGLAAISVTISNVTLETLAADPVACDVAMEIVAEAVGNAVRHGDASAIAVDVAVVDDDLLIRVQDNGQSGLGVGSGMGSQVLQDCCLRWERRSEESGVVVEALLPLAANSFVTTAA